MQLPIADLGITNAQQVSVALASKVTRGGESETDSTGVLKFTASDNPLQYDKDQKVIPSTNVVVMADSGGIADVNGDVKSLKVTAADGALTIDTTVAGVAMPPLDWYPENAETEYEFRWFFDVDNNAGTGLKVNGIDGLGADVIDEIVNVLFLQESDGLKSISSG